MSIMGADAVATPNLLSAGGKGRRFQRIFMIMLGCFSLTTPARGSEEQVWWIILERDVQGNSHLAESSTIEWRSDGRVYFWSHLFYSYPQDGLKSALIEYSVHCSERNIAEHRYIDFDANGDEIERGNNEGVDKKVPRPGTTGISYIKFACSSDVNREKVFLLLDAGVDRWTIGNFFSDPRPLVKNRDP